jgi:hypothetical protein
MLAQFSPSYWKTKRPYRGRKREQKNALCMGLQHRDGLPGESGSSLETEMRR